MEEKKACLVLMRHGESLWNKENLFTGWVDIPLSEKGVQEAIEGGKKIAHIPFDVIFTSTLVRAHMTLFLAMLQHASKKIPVIIHEGKNKQALWSKIYSEKALNTLIPTFTSWHLNERMYGALQGKNKLEMADEFGKEQVHIWRRSFDVAPPEGESLKMTAKRTVPYFKRKILPYLKEGKNVFIPAHGNSLRSIVMYLDKLSGEEVTKLELATGNPIIYYFENGKWIKEI